MKKLCFLVGDESAAHAVLDNLRETGLTDEDFHVIANDKQALDSLPDADLIEEKDVIGGVVRSATVGTTTGIIAGLVAATIPAAGVIAAGSAALMGALGGGSFGLWIGAVIGSSVPNSQLDQWREAIDAGQILIIVETNEEQESVVINRLAKLEISISEFGEKGDIPIL